MITLSIYPSTHLGTHDVNLSLVQDSNILYAYEEQKLSRTLNKEAKYFPDRALLNSFYTTGIKPSDVDVLCIVGPRKVDKNYLNSIRNIKKYYGIDAKIEFCPHHKAHSYYSVLTSPFKETLFWTLDAGGEDNLFGEFGFFKNKKFYLLDENKNPSLPTFYYHLTAAAGFADFEEGKVMGLSAYGSDVPSMYNKFLSLFKWNKECNFNYNFNNNKIKNILDFSSYTPDKHRPHKIFKYMNRNLNLKMKKFTTGYFQAEIAKTGQKFCEDFSIEILKKKISKQNLDIKNICLSGGFFQNILINERIKKELDLNVYIPPGPSDFTLAAGGGLYCNFRKIKKFKPKSYFSPYLGPSYNNKFILDEIKKYALSYKSFSNKKLVEKASADILNGRIIGWFQGKAEVGARALGARSVLADPKNLKSKSKINQILKRRDWFMPFAPSILTNDAKKIFENYQFSPYMNISFRVKEEFKKLIPSAIHVNNSLRPQIVKEKGLYKNLLLEIKKKRGIGCVLNTSFNVHGLPIVSSPENAINLYLKGMVDVLYIGNYRLNKRIKRYSAEKLLSEKNLKINMNRKYIKTLKQNKEFNNIKLIKINYKKNKLRAEND